MKKKLAILTITAMFFGALGFGLLAFPGTADAAKKNKCQIDHQDTFDSCNTHVICINANAANASTGHGAVHTGGATCTVDKLKGTSTAVTVSNCDAKADC